MEGEIKNQKAFDERRRRAAEVALRLFADKGFHNTKIKEVAEALGLSIGCLYNYVPSKMGLLQLVVQLVEERWEAATGIGRLEGKTCWEVMEKAIRSWFEAAHRNSDGVLFGYRDIQRLPCEGRTALLEVTQRRIDLFRDLIVKGVQDGEFKPVDAPVTAYTIVAMGHLWTLGRWYWLPGGYDLGHYADAQVLSVKRLLGVEK